VRHFPKKKWGQNFLVDPNLLRKIVRTIQPGTSDRMLEIGPGEGVLTERLLPLVGALAAIEIDPRLVDDLRHQPSLAGCHILHGDVLLLELDSLPFPPPVRVVGNIPYNITSPILFWLIDQRQHWNDAFLMVQKEVADRLVAEPGTKTYGRLTVMVGAFLKVRICFTIPPEVFQPRPQVDSTFIHLVPKMPPLVPAERFQRFEKIVAAAFLKRRKMLRNSLRGFRLPAGIEDRIDLTRRPETLSVEEFVELSSGGEK
jgi:16S rRNA (adenine1518-N6/adenine1519-N6)-dimethyltransferase